MMCGSGGTASSRTARAKYRVLGACAPDGEKPSALAWHQINQCG